MNLHQLILTNNACYKAAQKMTPKGMECHARTVNEKDLEAVVLKAMNKLLSNSEGYQSQLQQNIAEVIRASAAASSEDIDEKLLGLQKELLKRANNREGYDEIADEIYRLREMKQQSTADTASRDIQLERITELQDFIKSQPAEMTEFDEAIVKHWVQKITVWPDRYTVELKSGLSVDIEG